MNEQIDEFIGYAKFMAEETTKRQISLNTELRTFSKFFAELIVKECMKVAINKDSGYMHPADVAGYMAAGRSTAAQMIKEHFGVEE